MVNIFSVAKYELSRNLLSSCNTEATTPLAPASTRPSSSKLSNSLPSAVSLDPEGIASSDGEGSVASPATSKSVCLFVYHSHVKF